MGVGEGCRRGRREGRLAIELVRVEGPPSIGSVLGEQGHRKHMSMSVQGRRYDGKGGVGEGEEEEGKRDDDDIHSLTHVMMDGDGGVIMVRVSVLIFKR